MISPIHVFIMIYALTGLGISAVTVLLSSPDYALLFSDSQKLIDLVSTRKARYVFCLLLTAACGITFTKFRALIVDQYAYVSFANVPDCTRTEQFRRNLQAIDTYLTTHAGEPYERLPHTMGEFLNDIESLGFERHDLELGFICPHSTKKEISFEYFNPENLKSGIGEFILLYERPNNLPSKERIVVYNTVKVEKVTESKLHSLLLEQSKSAGDFAWEWSRVGNALPKSWWERERDKRVATIAGVFTLFSSFPVGLALFLGLKGLKHKPI